MAGEAGVRAVALGTSPLPVTPETTPNPRYERMGRLYGLLQQEQLTCGCHVHVSVASDEEGVAVLDRIRVWLPVLVAMSTNSPFWQGRDTGYAGYRTQVWARWPSAGPVEVHGSPAAYRALVESLLATGAVLDQGMVYFDARLSASYPTIEVRVPDVAPGRAAQRPARRAGAGARRHGGRAVAAPADPRQRRPRRSCGAPPGGPAATGSASSSCIPPPARRPRLPRSSRTWSAMSRPALEANGDLALVEEGVGRLLAEPGAGARAG